MGGLGGVYCKGTLTVPRSILITPPGHGQLEVQLLQIFSFQARAQLPGGILLVRLRAKGPVCSRRLMRSLPRPCPSSAPALNPQPRGPRPLQVSCPSSYPP